MHVDRCQMLLGKVGSSYRVHVDLRDLEFLCNAAMQLRMLADAVRLLADRVTNIDEGKRFTDLLDGLNLLEGDIA